MMWRNRSYFAAVLAACLIVAHLFFCAADILARPSALMGCLAAVLTPCVQLSRVNRSRASCNRAISASRATINFCRVVTTGGSPHRDCDHVPRGRRSTPPSRTRQIQPLTGINESSLPRRSLRRQVNGMVRRFYPAGSWGYKRRTEESAMELFTLGIDLGKTTFHLVGMNQRGVVMVRKRVSRNQLLRFSEPQGGVDRHGGLRWFPLSWSCSAGAGARGTVNSRSVCEALRENEQE